MNQITKNAFQPRISLLEFLSQRGWKPARDNGREEIAGLCPLHRDRHPSFYVNRRKQVFYCHGCGRGGGLAQLVHLLGELREPATVALDQTLLLEQTYQFYQRQLARFEDARAYLAARGIEDRAVIERMRIGYADDWQRRMARLVVPISRPSFFANHRARVCAATSSGSAIAARHCSNAVWWMSGAVMGSFAV
jgi:hypothetical protein